MSHRKHRHLPSPHDLRQLDLISSLEVHGCPHLLLLILSHLSSWDLSSFSEVCQDWSAILHTHFWPDREAGVSPVSESCSNTFTFWLLHTVIEADLPRLLFEEWRLHRQYTDRVSVLALKKLSGEQVTCAEYRHQLLAIGVRSGAVRLYQADVQGGIMRCRSEILTHRRPVTRLRMTERLVVSCGEDCILTVIRLLRDGSVMVSHVLQGHVSRIRCVSIAGSLLLSGSDDRSAKVWRVKESWSTLTTLTGHAWPVTEVELVAGLAVTADTDTIRLWSSPEGILLKTISGVTNCQQLSLDPRAGCLLLTRDRRLFTFTLEGNSLSPAWQTEVSVPNGGQIAASVLAGGQIRLCLGHSTLILICIDSNSLHIDTIDFLN